MSTTGTTERSWSHEALRDCLTQERLASYMSASGGDLAEAFRLYEWNMAASASIMTLTSMTEVVVRNALDRQLVSWAASRSGGRDWFDAAPLDHRGRADLLKARERATRRGKHPEVHGKVIAELSLGFWRFLVESRYLTSLWIPATHAAFPGGPADLRQRQRAVRGRLQQVTFVRNRAAHHEPIHKRDLLKDLRAATDLASWVSRDAGAWVSEKASLRQVVASKPAERNDREGAGVADAEP